MSRHTRKQIRSMRGAVIDMTAMRTGNEMAKAVGNARMNARGDVLNAKGEIEVSREQITRGYYDNAAKSVSLKPAVPDTFETPEQAIARLKKQNAPVANVPASETDMPSGIVKKRRLIKDGDD